MKSKVTSSSAARGATPQFDSEQGRLRSNFVAAPRLDETENHAQQPGNLGMSTQSGGQASMSAIGRVESVWRYPVKSMRDEVLPEIFAGFAGVYGDRLFAFKSSATPVGFPYLTGREAHGMLLYRPRFRDPGGRQTHRPATPNRAGRDRPPR
jgi:hypothetical protein